MDYRSPHDLYHTSYRVKDLVLQLHRKANSGHVGSALSCCDLLTFIRFSCQRAGDDLVLSKGHAASALYSTLAVAGEIEQQDLLTHYYIDGSIFPAHPPAKKIAGILFATGSLGHGPGLSAGIALAHKLAKSDSRVFCLTSDGELDEGSVWEAFLFAAHHKLSNLTILVDRNRIQGFGRTEDVMNIEPLPEKLASFGLEVATADGHSFESLLATHHELQSRCTESKRPGVIIAETTKGFGLGRLADTVDCHYLPMTEEDYREAQQVIRRHVEERTR